MINNRGIVFIKKGQYARAIQDFDQAIALDSKNVEAFEYRSIAKRQKGDAAGADQDLAAARALLGQTDREIVR